MSLGARLFRAFIVLLLLVALGCVILYTLFPASKIQMLLIEEVKKQWGAQLSIGRLDIRPLAVDLNQVTLSNIPNAPTGTRMGATRVTLHWSLRALLRERSFKTVSGEVSGGSIDSPYGKLSDVFGEWKSGWIQLHASSGMINPLNVRNPTQRGALTSMNLPCWSNKCAISEADAKAEITEEVVRFDHVQIRGPEIAVEGKGSLELPKKMVNLPLTAQAPKHKAVMKLRLLGPISAPQMVVESFKQQDFQMQIRL